ncbi:hypothetical protein EVAR_60916_1 [Eumeta japonica]|uniref:Uncharacterized protein n=1 Tax=Eumeta variegata TaxID=151549 RepID=A0A4C1ZIJ0_EUMVA|nr:hypothetical protein EVAR_60916_1 [Eumeta japonica]
MKLYPSYGDGEAAAGRLPLARIRRYSSVADDFKIPTGPPRKTCPQAVVPLRVPAVPGRDGPSRPHEKLSLFVSLT